MNIPSVKNWNTNIPSVKNWNTNIPSVLSAISQAAQMDILLHHTPVYGLNHRTALNNDLFLIVKLNYNSGCI